MTLIGSSVEQALCRYRKEEASNGSPSIKAMVPSLLSMLELPKQMITCCKERMANTLCDHVPYLSFASMSTSGTYPMRTHGDRWMGTQSPEKSLHATIQ